MSRGSEAAPESGGPNGSDGPDSPNARSDPPASRVRRAALLWGVVASLAFLVLVQGYQLLAFGSLPLDVVVVATAVVFVGTTLSTYLVGP